MNKEMKRILSDFLLKCVVLTCLLCLCAGAVTAKQRSDFNTYFTPYAVMTLKSSDNVISMSIDEKNYSFDLSEIKSLGTYGNYLYFTPFSCTFFLFESLYEFFSSFKD